MGDVLGNSMDMRGGQSKKSDEAGKGISDMGKSEFFFYIYALSTYDCVSVVDDSADVITFTTGKGATVPGTSINADDQVSNQSTGKADHLDLGFRKQT